MSRLIEKLTKMRQPEPQPMGFMLGRPSVEKPKLQVVAYLAADNLDKVSGGLGEADASLIEVSKSSDFAAVEKACLVKEGVPGGGWLRAFDDETLKLSKKAACDFLVFPSNFSAAITEKEKMGRVLELDTSLSDGMLRSLNDLPVDAVLVTDKTAENVLTLDRLMLIQRVAHMVNKPILVVIPDSFAVFELQALWNTGISGVVVKIVNEQSGEKLTGLRKAAEKLTAPSANKKARMTATIPHLQREAPALEDEGEEEEEDE